MFGTVTLTLAPSIAFAIFALNVVFIAVAVRAAFSKRKLLSEIDFASSFLEEGSYVDLYFSRNALEVISQHYGLVA